jgi:hypothetical protein
VRRILLVVLPATLLALAACSGSSDGASGPTTSARSGPGSTSPATTVNDGGTLATVKLGPTTTFMPDCSRMPTAADISTDVGVPVTDGVVTGSGTCQFTGLNDQSKYVVLQLLTDPADIESFKGLQASFGKGTPVKASGLKGAVAGKDHSVYLTMNDSVYVVQTLVTDKPLAKQVGLSVKVLQRWVKQ